MKYNLKPINTLLYLVLWVIFSSCSKQSNHENGSDSLNGQTETIVVGDTMLELEKGILVVFQDQKENYWFGGGNLGVYKYDGENLLLFSKEHGLVSNSVIGIQEDQFGAIYFDTPEGISKFDGKTFSTLTISESNASMNEWILDPTDLWFRMGWDGIGPYRYDGEKLYQLAFPKSDREDAFYSKYPNAAYSPYGIYSMYTDSDGAIWFGTSSMGLCRYDGRTVSWLYEDQLTHTPSGGDFGIRSIVEDDQGFFLFCNTRYRYDILQSSTESSGTYHIDYKKENGIGIEKGNKEPFFPYFMSMVQGDAGDIWMASYNDGLWRNTGEELIHYPISEGTKELMLFSIYKDHQGILWLATDDEVLHTYNGNEFVAFSIKQ